MNRYFPVMLGLFLSIVNPVALGYTAWKGGISGYWDIPANWAGGFPTNTTTMRLDHEYQTNSYTVIVRTDAITDTLSIQDYVDVPVFVRVENTGSLQINSLRMGSKEDDRESGFMIDGGSVRGIIPTNPAVTNTAFLIGDNPGCTATLNVLNGGLLSVIGSNGLGIATGKNSTGRLIVSNANIKVKESMILGRGPGAVGELLVSGASSICITGAFHIAKLDSGDLTPTGTVQVAGGVMECGTLNIGANGNGSLTLSGGIVHAYAGGITLGQNTSTAQLNIYGGTVETTESFMNIGHLDSTGTLLMTNRNMNVDGIISLGSSSRSTGLLDLSGGEINAKQLMIGAAASSTGKVHIVEGILNGGETVHVGPLGSGSLHLEGGTLLTTNFLVGDGESVECNLTGGELIIAGTSTNSLLISADRSLRIEKTLIKWNNPNLTEWITNAVSSETLAWSNGLAHGTFSINGFDGSITNDGSILYWNNLDNGSSFPQSAIWVEESPFNTWAGSYLLSGSNALWSADPDEDGLDNLTEFGLGGNPTNGSDEAILPIFQIGPENPAEYIYRQRDEPSTYGLTYNLELCTNLTDQSWNTNVCDFTMGPSISGFRTITNQIPTTNRNLFIRMRILFQ